MYNIINIFDITIYRFMVLKCAFLPNIYHMFNCFIGVLLLYIVYIDLYRYICMGFNGIFLFNLD